MNRTINHQVHGFKRIVFFSLFLFLFQFIATFAKSQNLSKADSLYISGEYAKAAVEYDKVLGSLKKQYGKNDTSVYAPAIFRAASSLEELSEFAKAEEYFEEGVNIYRKLENGKDDFWFILFANQLAFNYDAQAEQYEKEKDYFKAGQYYLKSLKFVDETFGKINYGYPETCKKLAGLYIKTKNYTKAEALFNEALKIDKTLHGKNDWRFAESYRNISVIFKEKGEYKKAKAFYEKAVRISENLDSKEDSLDFAISCTRLASLYHDFGDFSEAELFFIEAKKIRAEVLGTETLEYAESCNKLARLYLELGNYAKAESLFIESKNIRKKTVGNTHPLYAHACNNLGALYASMGDMKQAKQLYFEAYEIRRRTVGAKSKSYAISCNNIASVYFYEEHYQKAEEFLITAKSIIENSEPQSVFYIQICNHLAMLYDYMEQYDKAKSLYLEAKSLQETILGKNNPAYLEICKNLARNCEIRKKHKTAEAYYTEANGVLIYLLNESSKYMSEKERESYLQQEINNNFDIYYSFFIKRSTNRTKFTGVVYNNALNIKGQLLKSTIALRKSVLQSGDTVLIKKYSKMNLYGKILSEQYMLPIEKRSPDIKQLEEKRNKLEKDLARHFSGMQSYKDLESINWQDIQKSLKQDETAIEFVRFKYAGLKYWTDSTLYYALILRKNYTKPKAVFLFEEKQLEELLTRQENQDDFMYVKSLYSPKSAQSDSLYSLIFKPIEAYLKNIKSIHLSPTGLLNKIAFDALVSDKSAILSDKYAIFYSSTTAEAINKPELYPKDIKNVVLFGGLEYDLTPEQMLLNAKTIKQSLLNGYAQKSFDNTIDSISRNVSWAYLEGSKLETEKIDRLVADKNVRVKLYSGKQGSEEQFKALENAAPSVIHVSTHGFYFGDDKKSKEYIAMIDDNVVFAHSDNPLLRSGFILAGGNAAFQGRTIPDGVEDGVLTAAEISQMNLFDTKLVVLSACQTGLGDVKGNEGVYGLQRAFKMAGVAYLLFSLWEVPDYQTRELMSKFYEHWFSGMEVHEAFKKAQNHLKTKYAKLEGSAFAWAAFVLMN